MQEIVLEPSQVPHQLRGDYQGRKFKARVCETVTIPIDAGLWSGGSRDLYYALRLADGARVEMPGQKLFYEGRRAYAVTLEPGIAIVEHTIFQGRDLGLTFYVRPGDTAPLLPTSEAPELTREAQIVLACAGGLVASYRRQAAARQGIGSRVYDVLCERLATQGLLDSRRAITVKGRNVLATLDRGLVNGL